MDIIGKTMLGLNEVIQNNPFDLVVVFGDVNATAAGAIAAAQSGIPVMHVEAGLRSFDRRMPEEINRVITDHVVDYLMVSEPAGMRNLEKEGFDKMKYRMVGNIMIESLICTKAKWEKIVLPGAWSDFMKAKPVVATFHRPENVDDPSNLKRIVEILKSFSDKTPLVFPVHPRTKAKLIQYNLYDILAKDKNILFTEPMGYFEFLQFISAASLVITDSGGVQEETTFMDIPCVTFRKNTERPVTVELGTNLMMDIWDQDFYEKVEKHTTKVRERNREPIPFWDDQVSERIVSFIGEILEN